MNVKVISVIAYLTSLLPLSIIHFLGKWLGNLAWQLNSTPRKITEHNINLCFSSLSERERAELARVSLQETGKQLAECVWIWHRPTRQLDAMILETRGEHLLVEATKQPQGVLVVSPHIGNWELCSLPLSRHAPFTYFYRPPRNSALEPRLLAWRAHLNGLPAELDASGIRKGLKILRQGGMVGILPDQEPDRENGVFAPFFGHQALTMTLLPKLARRSGATVILCVAERLADATGWRIHYLPADPLIRSDNMLEAASAVNRDVERCIALCPEQYLWDYKRFNALEDGGKRAYKASL